ncbi:MAG: P-loop NTPase, partial [Phycisphaerae bacterium]|nr:P-loop NTPase [Phycisphaerae bacterium]
ILPINVDENLSVMSIGLLLDKLDDPVIWRGPRKYGVIRQFLKDVAWGRLDYLVVDSPPGTGDEPLAVAQLVGSPAGAIIVTTPQDLSIADVRRCVSFCNALSLPIVGIVENMSGFVCPNCGQRIDLFKAGGGQILAEETNVPFLGRIPIDPQIVTSGDSGTPFVQRFPRGAAAKVFADMIGSIVTPQQPQDQPAPVNTAMENNNMKIAIPLANGRLSMHFGHCEQFALVEVDEATRKSGETELLSPPGYEPGVLPRWLHEQGATVIIAGGMGQRAQQLFAQNNITVVVGASADAPEQLVSAYLEGTLQAGENICDH